MALLQLADRVDGVSRAGLPLEVADDDPGAARSLPRRFHARLERRHVLGALLERIAGRYQPPDLVEAKCAHGGKADAPVPAMRRIKGAAEEADARHARALACS